MAKRKTRASAPASTNLSTERRSLRSNTTTDTLVVPVPSPPPKKRQTTQQKFLCGTCGDEKTGRSFPDYLPSADCEHLINTCKACLRTWIDICVGSSDFIRAVDGDGNSTFAIRCPDLFNDKPCPAMMRPVNVEAAATEASYATFVRLARRYIEESTPGWRWCMASDCDNGQVHTKAAPEPQSPVDSPKKKGVRKRGKQKAVADDAAFGGGGEEETPDICTCTLCGAKACVPCDLPYHEGETCKEFHKRTHNSEDEASRLLIEKAFKKCPRCQRNVEKDGGCDYMVCTQCSSPFCWRCVQVFERGQFCACRPPPPANQPAGLIG